MKAWLLASASAFGLLCAGASAQAEGPVEDRFATDVLLGPTLSIAVPTSPSYALGVTAIRDPIAAGLGTTDPGTPDLDTIITGQIASSDAEHAASQAAVAPASASGGTPAETVEPHAAAGKDSAAAGGHAAQSAEPAAGTPPAHDEASGDHPAAEEASAFPTERGPEPFDIIRTMQFLQDQVARGNGRAIRIQSILLRRFGPVFLKADPKVWKDPRNMRAAVLFVLSGGPPEVLRRLIDAGDLDPAQRPLFDGALAYVQNDLEGAAKHLSEVDLATMEPGLAAHLNLVLGQIRQTKDPAAAIRHLDQARLLAPGGLIEEAALRMEVLIVEQQGDHDAADRLARQYFDRYARSSYSANFEARFAAVYAGRGDQDPPKAVATMLDVTARLSDADRSALLLAVARRSLVDGKLKLAELASEEARKLDGVTPPERQRADLYAVAAQLGQKPTNEAAATLDAINRDELRPEDVKLLEAAHSVVAGIDRTNAPIDNPPAGDQVADSSPVFDRAQKLLNEVSDDLGKAKP